MIGLKWPKVVLCPLPDTTIVVYPHRKMGPSVKGSCLFFSSEKNFINRTAESKVAFCFVTLGTFCDLSSSPREYVLQKRY